jgi:hypothetical protein
MLPHDKTFRPCSNEHCIEVTKTIFHLSLYPNCILKWCASMGTTPYILNLHILVFSYRVNRKHRSSLLSILFYLGYLISLVPLLFFPFHFFPQALSLFLLYFSLIQHALFFCLSAIFSPSDLFLPSYI